MRNSLSRIRFATAFFLTTLMAAGIVVGTTAGMYLFSLQAGPLWVRLSAGASVFVLVAVVALIVATLVFGRAFCAILCPLGTVQDIVDAVVPARNVRIPNARRLRYLTILLVSAFLVGGWAAGFQIVDPFTRFAAWTFSLKNLLRHDESPATAVMLGGMAPIAILVGIVVWKRRLFCTALCPVGTVLGVLSRFSLFKVTMNEGCRGCGICQKACPTGCIDVAGRSVDSERCLLCLRCLSACGHGGIGYRRAGSPVAAHLPDPGRRRFLAQGAAALAVAGLGCGAARVLQIGGNASAAGEVPLLPPGAMDHRQFAARCTGCLVCASACPAGIIKPSPYGFGPVRVEYGSSACRYDCTRCNAVCPSGALTSMPLEEKQWFKVGEAVVNANTCIGCGDCSRACPKDAVLFVDGGFDKVAEVAAFHCIGCGQCLTVCPSGAISVHGIDQRPMTGF